MEKTKEKRSFQAPHTFVILVVLILIAVAATYVVPAGEYTRYADEATGRTLVEAGSFHYVESAPVSFFSIPSLISFILSWTFTMLSRLFWYCFPFLAQPWECQRKL